MTPKLVLKPKTCDDSAGIVSLRKRLDATIRHPQANPKTNLNAKMAYVFGMSRAREAAMITKFIKIIMARRPFLRRGLTAKDPRTSPKMDRLEMAVLLKSVEAPQSSF